MTIPKDSLVLYRNRPALVKQVEDKLTIALKGGQSVKVRLKDVTLLHPGPIQSLSQLQPQSGEVKVAWELLAGETTTLAELAELAYEAFTPATAWAAWQLVDEGLYFRGTPAAIIAASVEEVAQEQVAREAKAADDQAWLAFLARAGGGQIKPEDTRFLREVEDVALGRQIKSRVLRDLGRNQSPENAHALLLELGYWDFTVNPYPRRLGLPAEPPEFDLPPLLEEERVDLTHLPAFAIDDEGSQDPDDALSLAGDRLWVHVADPAALVSPDSRVDIEARARAAKLYLPDMSVPMLPAEATELLALGLTETSPALSFGLDFETGGEITGVEIVPSWVTVTRLTYEEAEARLSELPLRSLYELAAANEARRKANGAISIDLPEVKIRVVNNEVVIQPLRRLRSHTLVREAMLMAGEAVARFALRENIPLPFTSQAAPETAELLEVGLAGMYARRRTMTRSQLTAVPGPHAGLGLDTYAQLTSPLRRYMDLVMHQQLRAHLLGEPLLDDQAILARVGAVEAMTGNVRQAERLSNKHWTLVYLLQQPEWRGQGVVVDKVRARATVLIPELDLITYLHLRKDLPLNTDLPLRLQKVNLPDLETFFKIDD